MTIILDPGGWGLSEAPNVLNLLLWYRGVNLILLIFSEVREAISPLRMTNKIWDQHWLIEHLLGFILKTNFV